MFVRIPRFNLERVFALIQRRKHIDSENIKVSLMKSTQSNNKRSQQWQMTFILIDFCLYVSSVSVRSLSFPRIRLISNLSSRIYQLMSIEKDFWVMERSPSLHRRMCLNVSHVITTIWSQAKATIQCCH